MNFIASLAVNIISILKYAILIRILLSWINPHGGGGKAYQIIHEITEPIMRPFRNLIPRVGMIDFSPIAAFFALDLAGIILYDIFSSF